MAKCVKCGADVPENSKFCTKCGTPVSETVVNTPQQAATPVQPQQAAPVQQAVKKEKQPMNKKTLRMLIIIAAAAVVVIAGIIVAVVLVNKAKEEKAKTLVVTDYFEIVFDGYDTKGTADIEFDYDEFYADALEAQGYDEDTTSTRAIGRTNDLIEGIVYEFSQSEDLSIGDEVTLTLTCDEDAIEKADVIMKDAEITVTIGKDDLKEVTKVNPFDDIEVTVSGMDGDATARVVNNATELPMSNLYFSNSYYLSVGDEVVLEIDEYYVEYALENYGIVYTETTMTYVVSEDDVNTYVESHTELTDEQLDSLVEEAKDLVDDMWVWDYTYEDVEYYGMYVVNYDYDETYRHNYVYVVMKATVTPEDAGDFVPVTVLIPARFQNLYVESGTGDLYSTSARIPSISESRIEGTYTTPNAYFTESTMFEELIADYEDEIVSYTVTGSLKDLADASSTEVATEEETTADEEATEEETVEE